MPNELVQDIDTGARRPLKSRNRAWAHFIADRLGNTGISPNSISILSIVFSFIGGGLFAGNAIANSTQLHILLLLGGAICVQLRLLMNMLDGMVAIEHHKHTATGGLYNEIPDRFDDIFLLIGAGIGCGWSHYGVVLGYTAAIAAVLTAYVRVLAGSLDLPQRFLGPMAKPHRMALLTLAAVLATVETVVWHSRSIVMITALCIITLGTLVTFFRRLHLTARDLTHS